MNAPHRILTPTMERLNAAALEQARSLANAATLYNYAMAAADGAYTRKVQQAERDLLKAIVAHWADGDCSRALEIVREELGEGDPVEPTCRPADWPSPAVYGSARGFGK